MKKKYQLLKVTFGALLEGIRHGIVGGPDGAIIFDIFAPQRDEYKKPGSGFAAD